MKNLFKIIFALIFAIPKLASAQNVQFLGTKDNIVETRNIARDDSAHEFALTDTTKHPLRPGRMISFNGSPYWWNGVFWYRLAGDTSTIPGQVNADWNSTSGVSKILNKPTFATVAISGSYTDLANQPTIPAAQVAVDWNASSGITHILNKPRITDSVWRVIGKDSILFRIIGPDGTVRNYSILDSAGGTGGGVGTVTNVAIGNLSPIFTTLVTNPTGSSSTAFTLSNAGAHKYLGNPTGSPAPPAYSSIVLADLPTIPLANTDATNGIGVAAIVGGVIRLDTSFTFPKFLAVSRPGGTDSVYYQVKLSPTSTVNILGFIDSVRLSAKGASNGYQLSYQTGPSSFYTRKVLPGTNITFSVASDSTLTVGNALTNVVNSLQVINAGNGRSLASGLNSARPTGVLGDFYLSTDLNQLAYNNGTSWTVIAGAPVKDTVHLGRIGIGAFPLWTSVAGDTLYEGAFKNSTTVSFTKNSDSTISATSLLAGVNSVNISGVNVSLVNDISSGTFKLYGFDGTSTRNFIAFSSLPTTVGTTNGLFPFSYKNRIDSNLSVINDRFYPTLDSIFTASPTLDTLYSKRFEFVAGTGISIANNSDLHKNSYTITATGTGGAGNSNSGGGYRWAIVGGSAIKTAFAGNGIGVDSVTNTNGLTFTIDPLVVATLTNVQTLTNKKLISPNLNGSSTASFVWTATDNLGNGTWSPATTGFVNPMTTLGDMMIENATPAAARLAGNTTTTMQVLSQIGTGSVSALPVWHTMTKADIGLGSVENTALSTWPGSTNLTIAGTFVTGTWNASTIDAAHGGTGNTSYTPYAVITGGTTSTGPLQQVSGVGTSLQSLVSNGPSALPTWQSIVNSLTGTTNEIAFSSTGGNITASTPQPIAVTSTPTFAGGTYTGAVNISKTGNFPLTITSTTQSGASFVASSGLITTGYTVGRSINSDDAQDFFIFDNTASTTRFNINSSGKVTIPNTLQVSDGTQGAGKIFTSDASGNGSWQTPASFTSGTYTPTITNTFNINSSTPGIFTYSKVGNIVTVSGRISLSVTTGTTTTQIGVSLPIASTISNVDDVVGNAASASGQFAFPIQGDTTNHRGAVSFTSGSSGTSNYFFTFQYIVD